MRVVTMPVAGSLGAGTGAMMACPRRQQAAAASRAVIVEVFGPAGAGKTTFAAALHRALQSSGSRSEFFSSARPADPTAHRDGMERRMRHTVLAPLSRAAKVFGAVADLGAEDPVGTQLLALFPGRSRMSYLRHRRYLARLHRACSATHPPGTALILDQGYLSALCSLAARFGLAQAPAAMPLLARAVDLVPSPDLVVWVQTPGPVVRDRLERRLTAQSRVERLFELDMATLMDQACLAEAVCQLLRARACPIVQVRGLAPPGDEGDVRIAADALATLAAEYVS